MSKAYRDGWERTFGNTGITMPIRETLPVNKNFNHYSFHYSFNYSFGTTIIPYRYNLRNLEEGKVKNFIISELTRRPECINQLKDALNDFEQYRKYIKLLVMA
jgi:hypothetical protein